ncbi:ataxin-1-like [Podarcis raffonei]|uniref:ataxin-1-like n=1 Tax=Podarcis raffonei TaxID=65483 RepID=UPI0023296AFF|nr:ataxin-1-like [Podarcis raffonei]XP_053255774.1 ataxin-1-like [Podarcis raffonei]
MRAAQERGQEFLPPKKRDLPVAANNEEPGRAAESGLVGGGGSETSVEWSRGLATGRQSQAPSRYTEAGGSSDTVTSLTVDQYGLLYKVAMPPATFSPVVNVSPLPPAFSMTSQLIPHPGIPYSPIHYTQLPPAPLQFVGSHYSVPYAAAVPPGFLPSHLLSSSASLAASHIPHFVPYAPLLAEDSAPSPQAAHSFGKTSASVLPSGSLQPHVGGQPLDVTQGRIPVYYQMSRLPAGYSSFEASVAGPNTEQCLQENQLDPKVTANGVQRSAVGAKESEAEGQWPRTTVECSTEGTFLTSSQILRTEISVPSQRSTPDTDLEVQRVVGVLASQDYPVCSAQQKDGLSPLNLSHRNPPEQKAESMRNPVELVVAATAEKSHFRRLSAKSPEEQLRHRQILKGITMANGRPVSGSLHPGAQDGLGGASPEGTAYEGLPDTECAHSQSHLPSHFMKGAIIQLATGELKRVEDLQTQDFVRSAEVSGGLKIDSSTVVDIQESPWQGFVTLHFVVGEQQSKVSIDVPPEHPFFVYGQGWSSCSPERTNRLFSLSCHRLQVGDVCISISLQSLNGRLVPQASPQSATRERPGRGGESLQELQKNPLEKGGVAVGSPQESTHHDPVSLHGWAGPSFQRSGEEPRPPLLRPSFIPQEVKLSIEGRSNAGK